MSETPSLKAGTGHPSTLYGTNKCLARKGGMKGKARTQEPRSPRGTGEDANDANDADGYCYAWFRVGKWREKRDKKWQMWSVEVGWNNGKAVRGTRGAVD
jgi:hypothetical protein